MRFGSIAAYVHTWPVRTYAEKGQVSAYRGVLSAGGMVYSAQQIGICGGTPDERKELSNSLRNDSLLSKRIKPGYNYSCFSAGIDCGSSIV